MGNDYINKLEEELNSMMAESFPAEKAEEMFYLGLHKLLELVFLKTTNGIYSIIKEHPVAVSSDAAQDMKSGKSVLSILGQRQEDVEPKSLDDYLSRIKRYQGEGRELKTLMGNVGKEVDALLPEDGELGRIKDSFLSDVVKSRDGFLVTVNGVVNFVEYAIFLQRQAEIKENRDFLKLVTNTLPTMQSALRDASKGVFGWNKYGKHYAEKFNVNFAFFNESVDSILRCAKDLKKEERKLIKKLKESDESEQKQAVSEQVKSVRKVEPVKNLAEEERQRLIYEANMMYDELVTGTMRDLEAQVPYSVREMYDYFVNVKFANFVKSFRMPLTSSTTAKTAKEAINQLNGLNNYISRMSENATTTNVYMMKE